jgi:hypothetical protein
MVRAVAAKKWVREMGDSSLIMSDRFVREEYLNSTAAILTSLDTSLILLMLLVIYTNKQARKKERSFEMQRSLIFACFSSLLTLLDDCNIPREKAT